MDWYIVALRIVHIVAGAFWFGASVVFALFLEPAAAATGPASGPFMRHLTQKMRFPIVIAISSLISITAGALLFWRSSGGLENAWLTSGPGVGFTLGALAAIAAWLVGFTVLRPGVERLAAAGAAGAAADIARIQKRLRAGGLANVSLLAVALAAMASARYL